MNEFAKAMSQRSDFELYLILNYEKDSYKAKALEAAKEEFISRAITDQQINEFEEQIEAKKSAKKQKKQQQGEFKKKAWEIGKLFIPTEKETLSQNILSLCAFMSLIYVFYLIKNFNLLYELVRDQENWDLSTFPFIVPFLLYPIGIFGLYKSKTFGWYLIIALLTFDTLSSLIFGQLEFMFPKPSITANIIRNITLIGIIFFLFRTRVLTKYGVKKQDGIVMISIITFLYIIFLNSIGVISSPIIFTIPF